MQQQGAMFRVMPPSLPAASITTEQIQKYLDENKKLILAILDNQNLGKLAECAQYQAQLQKNLMYLAAIADGQQQPPPMTPQMPHPAMQQGAFFMQHPQAASMAQQPGMFSQRPPFSSPLPVLDPQQQQHHLTQQPHPHANLVHMPMRPVGPTNSIHPSQNDANVGPGSSNMTSSNPGLTDIHGGNIQEKPVGSDTHGNSGVAHGGHGEEPK